LCKIFGINIYKIKNTNFIIGGEKMTAFRILLIIFFMAIIGYTAIVIANHGWNLFPFFFGEMFAKTWSGQFNLDFMCLLTLSGLWLAWRHYFTFLGILIGLCGFFGGIMFLSLYLFIVSFIENGDIEAILLGKNRNKALL
jgi:hypothetical protein